MQYSKGKRQHPNVVCILSQIIHSNNEEYFVLTEPSKSRSVKHHFVNNNHIKTSLAAFDYAKFANKLSGVPHEIEKKRPGFFCEFEIAICGKKIYICDRTSSRYDNKKFCLLK